MPLWLPRWRAADRWRSSPLWRSARGYSPVSSSPSDSACPAGGGQRTLKVKCHRKKKQHTTVTLAFLSRNGATYTKHRKKGNHFQSYIPEINMQILEWHLNQMWHCQYEALFTMFTTMQFCSAIRTVCTDVCVRWWMTYCWRELQRFSRMRSHRISSVCSSDNRLD